MELLDGDPPPKFRIKQRNSAGDFLVESGSDLYLKTRRHRHFGAPMQHLTIEQLIGLPSLHTTNDISYLPQPNQVSVVISDMVAPPDVNPTAFILAFTEEGDVVLTDNVKRGPEACGGHRDPILDEDGVTFIRMETAAEAAEREGGEEAGVILKSIEPLGIFRSITGAEKPEGYRYPYFSRLNFSVGI